LCPYLLHRKIEREVKNFGTKIKKLEKNNETKSLEKALDKDGFLNHAHYYLLLIIKLLADAKDLRLDPENAKQFSKLYENAKVILRRIVKEKKKDPKFSMPHLFKSDDLVSEIKDSIYSAK
jgi:hypothetical protein